MSDYIKREDAIDTIEKYESIYKFNMSEREQGYNNALEIVAHAIGDMPSADVVEVVRCKDCKHWLSWGECGYDAYDWNADDYCSYAERKTNNE